MMLLSEIEQLIDEGKDFTEKAQAVVNALYQAIEHYSWVGVYLLQGDHLHLLAWAGPEATEHTTIPITVGICGLAAREGKTVNIPDVNADPRYLACFPQMRSELVVPIRHDEVVIGEIDIDSDQGAAFQQRDIDFVEAVADCLGKAWKSETI